MYHRGLRILPQLVIAMQIFACVASKEITCKTLTSCDCLQPTDPTQAIEVHCPSFADDELQLYYKPLDSLLVQCFAPMDWEMYNANGTLEALREDGNLRFINKLHYGSVPNLEVSNCNLSESTTDLTALIAQAKPKYLKLRTNSLPIDANIFTSGESYDFLESLDMESNSLQTIPYEGLDQLTNLRHLSLDFNRIERVDRPFGLQLTQLQLAQNKINFIAPNVFKGMKSLKTLHLWGNNIEELEDAHFEDLENLTLLELMNNSLERISESLFSKLPKLQTIDLENNKLTSLPARLFSNNKGLMSIRLGRNRLLKALPEELFASLSNLKNVRLNSCSLRSVSPHLFVNSLNIEVIFLNDNKLANLPANLFKGLANLHTLNLSHNQIEELPNELFNDLKELKQLDLRHNPLKQIYLESVQQNLVPLFNQSQHELFV